MADSYDHMSGEEQDADSHTDNSHKYLIDSNEPGSFSLFSGSNPNAAGETPKEYLTRQMGGKAAWYKEQTNPLSAREVMRNQASSGKRIIDSVRPGATLKDFY